ncbi:50S ribosomal protein L11 methyltransferase [Marinicella sp. W31]|uniref:50S ribosomal protein L11 methyltransferase n=1 Tax=Marinicella sp. W31 TaxID=3023713 RepID=UPI0037581A77
MPYYELTVHCSRDQLAAIEATLEDSSRVALTIKDGEDNPIYEPKPGEMPLWDWLSLTVLFMQSDQQLSTLKTLQNNHPECEFIATQLDDQVWERVWMSHFKPLLFGRRTWIIPGGYDVVEADDVNILLDPGLAFGTGTHATTGLCLEWLDQHPPEDHCVVDFGCGSGILAVAALKLGASKVHCVDIDPQAIQATLMNAETNAVSAGIDVVEPENVAQLEQLDGVIANILAAPLMELEAQFADMLKPNGYVVLSGILKEQLDWVVEKYSQRFVDIKTKIKDDWALVFARKG